MKPTIDRAQLVRALRDSTAQLIKVSQAIGSCDHQKRLYVCELTDQAIINQRLLCDLGEPMVSGIDK